MNRVNGICLNEIIISLIIILFRYANGQAVDLPVRELQYLLFQQQNEEVKKKN